MKVLIVSDIFYPHTGGVSEHMLYLWHNLKKLGHEAKILAFTTSYGDYKEKSIQAGVDGYIGKLDSASALIKAVEALKTHAQLGMGSSGTSTMRDFFA